jgi:hypothetical protein
MSEENVQPNTLTTEQGAERIKSLMFPEAVQEKPITPPAQDEGQEEEDFEDDEQEGVEADSEEEVAETDDEAPELYTVKVDGEEKQVTIDDLVKGYQLEAHYTQKSQKLAEEVKAVAEERKILNGVSQKFEQLNDVVTYLEGVNTYLESTLPPAPGIDLAKTNPAEYIQQKEMRESRLRDMQAINYRVMETKEKAKAITAELQAAGAKVIRQKMPELLEPQNISAMYSYLQESYGYEKDLIDKNVDPNLFIMAEKARRFDEMMSKASKPDFVKQKVHKQKVKPKSRPGQGSQQQAVMSKFRENPSQANAARAIRELL